MGVYIKGKRKPDTCYDCDFVDGSDDCFFGLGYTGDMCDCVYEDCPLVDVKTPHGALIDRDTLMEGLKPRWDCMDDHDFADKGVWQALEETPILVEAEVE